MTKESGVPQNNTDLREMVYHTDARVSSLETQVGSVVSSLQRIENHLLHRPPTNWAAWASVGLALIVSMVGAMFGAAKYIDLTLEPIRSDLIEHRVVQESLEDARRQTLYELGVLHQWKRTEEGKR